MRAMDDQACLNRLLARLFGIQRGPHLAYRHRPTAAAAGDHAGAGRSRVDVDAACLLEWTHELVQAVFVGSFDDQVQRVLALDDGLAFDLHPMLPDVGAAHVIQQRGAHVRILGRAVFGCMMVSHNIKRHCAPLSPRASEIITVNAAAFAPEALPPSLKLRRTAGVPNAAAALGWPAVALAEAGRRASPKLGNHAERRRETEEAAEKNAQGSLCVLGELCVQTSHFLTGSSDERRRDRSV